jgi:MIZ/SP-RING zinc finger/MYND finger
MIDGWKVVSFNLQRSVETNLICRAPWGANLGKRVPFPMMFVIEQVPSTVRSIDQLIAMVPPALVLPPKPIREEEKTITLPAEGCRICHVLSTSLQRCSRCQSVWYCSNEHQLQDWKTHETSCRPFSDPAVEEWKTKCDLLSTTYHKSRIEGQSKTEDREITTSEHRVSLHCPLSRGRIDIPVITKSCLGRHVATFDLRTFLELQYDRDAWACPICDRSLFFNDLVRDTLFDEWLMMSGSGEQILLRDGQVIHQEETKPIDTPVSSSPPVEIIEID